jgi:hypothetical protein
VIDAKRKLLLWEGRVDEALAHLAKYHQFNVLAARGETIPEFGIKYDEPQVRSDFGTNVEQQDFFVGFCRYVLGQAEAARVALEQSRAVLEERTASNTIGQVGRVTLMRTPRLYDAVTQLHGKPAPTIDLEQGMWLNNAAFKVEEERGKVIALFISPYNYGRGDEYAQALQAYLVENWDRGFRAAWIAIPKGNQNPEQQLATIRTEMERLGVTYPVALPISSVSPIPEKVYKDYNVSVGTQTVVFIDRAGKVAWYHQDPTFRELAVSRLVAERLLAESAP